MTRWMTQELTRPDAIFCFRDGEAVAVKLADRLNVPCYLLDLHTFPDGESRLRADVGAKHPALYRSLHDPNPKIMDILLAAAALRDRGAQSLTLIAPYLPYMRQDRAFQPGEAVSQQVFGTLLATHFDSLLAVDPHLHRTHHLAAIFAGKPAIAVSAAAAMADHARQHRVTRDTLVIGPDQESETLAAAVAMALGVDHAVGRKVRHGDRHVEIRLPEGLTLRDRSIILVDDIVSSGATLATLTADLAAAGVTTVDVYATHALCDDHAVQALHAAGVRYFGSSDAVPHPTNRFSIVPALAVALDPHLA